MPEKILKYLKKRRDGMVELMKEKFKETREVDAIMLEVYLTYNAIISDIKNDRLE